MSDAYLEKIAGELAHLALADEERSSDEKIVAQIAEIVGASSQTLQEAFLTAVRVRRAEKRARALLAERASEQIEESNRLLTDSSNQSNASRESDDQDEDERAINNLIKALDADKTRNPPKGGGS